MNTEKTPLVIVRRDKRPGATFKFTVDDEEIVNESSAGNYLLKQEIKQHVKALDLCTKGPTNHGIRYKAAQSVSNVTIFKVIIFKIFSNDKVQNNKNVSKYTLSFIRTIF